MISEFRAGIAPVPTVYTPLRYEAVRQSKPAQSSRPVARGKFLYVDGRKFFLRGVTYGPFRPDAEGCEYKTPSIVARDFAAMAAAGVNTVRTYTAVPTWLLDCAAEHGLKVLVGIAWAQHIAFLDSREISRGIESTVRETVRNAAGHPAVLGFTIGNEIPAPIVRWFGARKVERFLRGLTDIAKSEDPGALVTYVNYPTTEYLRLPFLDFFCFNVYLEAAKDLTAYVARLQNLAEERPVVLGELGLDSERNGAQQQATTLEWQIKIAFAGGCAGVCVFAWTDEWFRGGHDIEGWAFGLTDRERCPKPALATVAGAFRALPFPDDVQWPRISVVVCTYNGARHIRQTCEALEKLDYPNHEVLIVCDGSTDATLAILADFSFKVVAVQNGGLSRARNLGLQTATGEIVAYLDDDAYPDEHWLKYLAWSFRTTTHDGIGGPNFPPPEDDFWAMCVAHSPGGPNHVLLADDLAEHIPGCNMAFRKSALERVGGFDRDFRIAGDDVDVCWKIQAAGGTLGFSPSAVVWHHRRNSAGAYLRQQYNYGRAEAMLAAKWPEKFNSAGHIRWGGRIYGSGRATAPFNPKVAIYQGTWGSAPFQSMYEQPHGLLSSLTMMPEWHLLTALLAVISLFGLVYPPLLFALVILVPALVAPIAQSIRGASAARLPSHKMRTGEREYAKIMIAVLHYLQPLTRLRGRIAEDLRPLYFRKSKVVLAGFGTRSFWQEKWRTNESRLEAIEKLVQRLGISAVRGGDFDAWDLELCGGRAGRARIIMAVEEHGSGRQLVRYRVEPRFSPLTRGAMAATSLGMLAFSLVGAQAGLLALSLIGVVIGMRAMFQSLAAAGAFRQAAETAGLESA